MWWADTTAGQLKQRNSDNSDWIVFRELDGTMLMESGTAAAPGLAFSSDVDTGLFRSGSNELAIATNGVKRAEFSATSAIFNNAQNDYDFRIEGTTKTSLFRADAANDRIGIGTGTPSTLLELVDDAPYITIRNSTEQDTDGGRESRIIFEGERSGGEISTLARIEASHEGTGDDDLGKLEIQTNDGSTLRTRLSFVTQPAFLTMVDLIMISELKAILGQTCSGLMQLTTELGSAQALLVRCLNSKIMHHMSRLGIIQRRTPMAVAKVA